MIAKRVRPRSQARLDVEDAVDHYAREAGTEVALGFIEALERAYRAIGEDPGDGWPRYAHELNLPGLRHRRIARFPWLIFYVEQSNHIDVWRVLDARRDIPAWLDTPPEQ